MKNWLSQVVQIVVTNMPYEEKKCLIQNMQSQFEQFDNNTQCAIRDVFQTQFETKDSVYILSVFCTYLKGSFWGDDLIKCVLKEDNYSLSESIMIEFQLKYLNSGSYTERKRFRQQIVNKMKQMGLRASEYIPMQNRNQNRIAIVTEQLLSIGHSPTRYVMDSFYYLKKLGYEVMIFICPSDGYLDDNIWYHYRPPYNDKKWHGQIVEVVYKEETVPMMQVNLSAQDCLHGYDRMLQTIREWNPWFVFEVGLVNSVGELLADMTTVVNESLTVKECPVSNAQILVRYEKNEKEMEDEIERNLKDDQTQLWLKENMPFYIDRPQIEITREQLGLPEDLFLLAVVGNRLDTECDETFIKLIKCILSNESNVGVVVIGKTLRLQTHFLDCSNVFFIGHQQYLQNVLEQLDLYINPERAGGGYSSQIALQAGLPVVTLPGCDVASVAGNDFEVSDYEEMYDIVEKYIIDESFRKKQQECARQRSIDNSEDTDYMKRKIDTINDIMRMQEGNEYCPHYTMKTK